MAALALANALKDFGAQQSVSAEPLVAPMGFPPLPEMSEPVLPDFPLPEPVDTDALIAEAVAQAEEALRERLATEHADAIQAERERHARDMADLQSQLADDASSKIQAGIADMEAKLVELTSAVTARILSSVLTDDLSARSIERLAEIIREALADDEAVRIRVRGSLSLFDALKEKLPRYAEQFDFAESPNFDLTVTIDDSVYETRLAEWSAVLAEVLS